MQARLVAWYIVVLGFWAFGLFYYLYVPLRNSTMCVGPSFAVTGSRVMCLIVLLGRPAG